jgi:hypothetical protein
VTLLIFVGKWFVVVRFEVSGCVMFSSDVKFLVRVAQRTICY